MQRACGAPDWPASLDDALPLTRAAAEVAAEAEEQRQAQVVLVVQGRVANGLDKRSWVRCFRLVAAGQSVWAWQRGDVLGLGGTRWYRPVLCLALMTMGPPFVPAPLKVSMCPCSIPLDSNPVL